MTHYVPCPTCSKRVPWTADSTYRPFCSRRCKLVDLGDWLTERNRIAGEDTADDTDGDGADGDGCSAGRGDPRLD